MVVTATRIAFVTMASDNGQDQKNQNKYQWSFHLHALIIYYFSKLSDIFKRSLQPLNIP
jgi:hypothetical protein